MDLSFLYVSIVSIFWFISQEKTAFFYIYLWQLKEYHPGRFLDHFRTEKGKRIILHPLRIAKLLLFFLGFWMFYPGTALIWMALFFVIYAAEFLFMIAKKFKKPVFTLKALILSIIISLIFLGITFYAFFVKKSFVILLTIDILSPLIISAVILLLQPLTFIYQLIVIAKAKKKMASFKNLTSIAITGSFGKTSTKEFLTTILSKKFKVLKTLEHQNSEIAIAKCVLNNLRPEHQIFVCEMGAYNKGKIKQVASMVLPKIGIVSGINQQHLALFGSMENLISAEGGKELLKCLPEQGTAILNNDCPIIVEQKQKFLKENPGLKMLFCSVKNEVNDVKVEKDKLSFKIDSVDFKVNCAGQQNLENLILAIACARELNMSLEEIAKASGKISLKQGAVKIFKGSGGADIIDSAYSANPSGVTADLEYLKLWPGKKVIVMPCLIELGTASAKVHSEIGEKIGQVCDLAIITSKDKFKELKQGAMISGMNEKNIVFMENPKQIFEKVKKFYSPNNVILLEGKSPAKLIKMLTNEQ